MALRSQMHGMPESPDMPECPPRLIIHQNAAGESLVIFFCDAETCLLHRRARFRAFLTLGEDGWLGTSASMDRRRRDRNFMCLYLLNCSSQEKGIPLNKPDEGSCLDFEMQWRPCPTSFHAFPRFLYGALCYSVPELLFFISSGHSSLSHLHKFDIGHWNALRSLKGHFSPQVLRQQCAPLPVSLLRCLLVCMCFRSRSFPTSTCSPHARVIDIGVGISDGNTKEEQEIYLVR